MRRSVAAHGHISQEGKSYRVSGPLECVACGGVSERRAPGWQVHLVNGSDEDDAPRVVFYCSYCAMREFGEFD